MRKAETPHLRIHHDADLFRDAVRFTAEESGFVPRLVEKDYFCTVLLAYLSEAGGDDLVFKGGTCLAKVHSDLYRLSEDLDYTIPVALDTPRADRSQRVEPVKGALRRLNRETPVFRVVENLTGANRSTQYLAVVGYASMLNQQEEFIKIEVSLREPLLKPVSNGTARTMLRSPLTNSPIVAPIAVRCIDQIEALAEKFRAALSRREPAVRDFYDIDHGVRKDGLRPDTANFVDQVRRKLEIPGNDPVDVSDRRLEALRRQVEPELRPVLRNRDFAEFDLDRAFEIGVRMAERVQKK